MGISDPVSEAASLVGRQRLVQVLGVSDQAVRKWQKARRMPRTEWTGETNYSARIEELTHGAVTRERLLASWPQPDEARDAA